MIAAGVHGGDGAKLARALGVAPDEVLDLSASLNPLAPDPTPVLAAHLDSIRSYPDPEPAGASVAAAIGVDPETLLLTNGAAEAIALVAAEMPVGSVEDPEFSLYRRHLGVLDPTAPRWRSNPHNPTGALAGAGEEAGVWDESFWPLCTGSWTRGDAGLGAVVIGSLTKLLACPGLRVGYVLCPDRAMRERLAARQPAWSVNGLVCAALPEMLAAVELARWAREVAKLRERLGGCLRRHGLAPLASDANWLLVDAPGLRERLAARGVLVRDCASFGMPGVVRIAVPSPSGLDRLDSALAETLAAAPS
ncbi:MAG: aminotransferase class I/II-fold pyridoxal phosphate-dependent enzyme [Acidimicrobiales bacterium]